MANEASLREWIANPTSFTVANGTGIEQGTLLAMTDPQTAVAATASGSYLAGIAAVEKVANDGSTRLSVYQQGLFDMVASGTFQKGEAVMAASDTNFPNTVMRAVIGASGAALLGIAQETASDAETVLIKVNVGAVSPNNI